MVMKVAVLEWICSGGVSESCPAEETPPELLMEGFAMASELAKGLDAGGCEVLLPVDLALLQSSQLECFQSVAELFPIEPTRGLGLEQRWQELGIAADIAIVIAPEFDGLLNSLCEDLRLQGTVLLNCSAEFLENASNKLSCARHFLRDGIPHPPSRRLSDVDAAWLDAQAASAEHTRWVVKPIDGAGSEGLLIVSNLARLLNNSEDWQGRSREQLLVQPWLPGVPLSRSAIVDCHGVCQWLPPLSQDFEWLNPAEISGSLKYRGCRTMPDIPEPPIEMLQKSLASLGPQPLGWIGVDLLYEPETDRWTVIEVNPRLTTSFVALSRACKGNLSIELLAAHEGSTRPPVEFDKIDFRLTDL